MTSADELATRLIEAEQEIESLKTEVLRLHGYILRTELRQIHEREAARG